VIRAEAARPEPKRCAIRLGYDVAAVRAAPSELARVAELVRDSRCVRALTRAELLLTDAHSPLYGSARGVVCSH
jgi:hypothetical protein